MLFFRKIARFLGVQIEALCSNVIRMILQRSAGSEAEKSVYEFLIDTCEVVPNVSVAIALLDCASTIRSPREELSNKLG